MDKPSWADIIQPCIDKLLLWDKDLDGLFVPYAMKHIELALHLRGEFDPVINSKNINQDRYREDSEIGIICSMFYLAVSRISLEPSEYFDFIQNVFRYSVNRGLDIQRIHNVIMNNFGFTPNQIGNFNKRGSILPSIDNLSDITDLKKREDWELN